MTIEKKTIESLVQDYIKNTDMFLVSLSVSANNVIIVEIDADTSIDIDTCAELNNYIESKLDRQAEDFELTVMSTSLSEPFKMLRQYKKNIGKIVTVTTAERKYQGELLNVTDENVSIKYKEEKKVPPKNKKKVLEFEITIPFNDIKKTERVILFKNKIL